MKWNGVALATMLLPEHPVLGASRHTFAQSKLSGFCGDRFSWVCSEKGVGGFFITGIIGQPLTRHMRRRPTKDEKKTIPNFSYARYGSSIAMRKAFSRSVSVRIPTR
jgi:hypothetical protein